MFLETLDVKSNDVVIFSQNRFDFESNFWLIHKNRKVKIPEAINYFDVCEFVKNNIPKNLVVYRLLTNCTQIDAFSTKFGYFLNIDGEMEIIYFDPIFALKDLNHLKFDDDTEQFRFKIQQLGLTSATLKLNPDDSFSIVYNTNLRAYEAKYQNDKIFADAIFAFDESYNDNIYLIEKELKNDKSILPKISSMKNIYSSDSKIIEVQKKSPLKLNKLDLPDTAKIENIREKKMNMLKDALGISSYSSKKNGSVSNFFEIGNSVSEQVEPENTSGLLKLFKSAEKQDISKDKFDNFVLKITK